MLFALITLVLSIVKYPALVLLIWALYSFVVQRYMMFRLFRNLGKVCAMSKTFIPVVGDLLQLKKYKDSGKYAFLYTTDLAYQSPESKMSLMMTGKFPKLYIHDHVYAEKIIGMVGT